MKEEEIRPQRIFDEYLQLTQKDTETYFANATREACNCPACGKKGEDSFTKHGFNYQLCPDCKTLFVSPRPIPSAFDKYYTESPSSKYWATTFYKETAEARRQLVWKPKAKLIADWIRAHGCEKHLVVDIGAGYGLFAEEIQQLTGNPVLVIEPAPHLADVCRGKGLEVIEKFLENIRTGDLPSGPKVFVSFELFEHLHNPTLFLENLKSLMLPGDYFIFTTLSGTGLDIQLLWENSKSVSPPHHLNFFNPISVKHLLEEVGFTSVDVTTPGKLDMDISYKNRELITDRFWRNLLSSATEESLNKWQAFISSTGNSSHMMTVCQKA